MSLICNELHHCVYQPASETDLTESREQLSTPELSRSWLSSIHHYNELEGHTSLISQTSSTDGLQNGRPDSPLRFDHEEILQIETDVCNVPICAAWSYLHPPGTDKGSWTQPWEKHQLSHSFLTRLYTSWTFIQNASLTDIWILFTPDVQEFLALLVTAIGGSLWVFCCLFIFRRILAATFWFSWIVLYPHPSSQLYTYRSVKCCAVRRLTLARTFLLWTYVQCAVG